MADIWFDVDAALAEVPVNIFPLTDDTDFKTREASVTYDQAGMDLVWNFVTTAGAYTQTAVTPTTAGNYDWTNEGDGMYAIEIPLSGGASINNDTEGFGWFTGFATGVLPWRGPVCGFRASGLNDLMIDSAYSATRGLTGTAVPAAAADAAGGLPISDAGGLDMDSIKTDTAAILVDIGAAGAGLTGLRDMILPKKNTALNNIEFEMVDATDFATPETGLTVSGTRSIDGGAFGAATGTIAEVGNGIYQLDASAADMNGSIITFRFTATGAADTFLAIRTGG